MIVFWRQFMALMVGICGCHAIEKKNDDGYIGCYEYSPKTKIKFTVLDGNNGLFCKNHCFPKSRYAGTAFYNCYCGNNSVGVKVKDTKCSAACPNPYLDVYKCGSPFRLTMYDSTVMRTTKSTTSSSTIFTSTSGQNSTVSTNGETPKSLNIVWYIVIPFLVVIINVIILCILVYRYTKKRKLTQRSLTPVNVNDSADERNINEVPTNGTSYGLESGSDDADDSYYDNTSTYKSNQQWKHNNRNRWLNNRVINATKSDRRCGQCQAVPETLKEDHLNMIKTVNEQSGPATRNMNADLNVKFSSYDRKKGDKALRVDFSTGRSPIKRRCNCDEKVYVSLRSTDKTNR